MPAAAAKAHPSIAAALVERGLALAHGHVALAEARRRAGAAGQKVAAAIVQGAALPFKVGSDYKELLQKQPGKGPIPHVITVDGKKKQSFDLNDDQEIKIKL